MDETLNLGLGIKAAGAVESQRATKSLIGTLKDYVKGMFSVKDATTSTTKAYSSQMSTMNSADAVYQKMSDSFGTLKRRFMAFVGVYAASDIFNRLYEEGKKVEEMVTQLANRFGSDRIGNQMTRWVNETVSTLPVARDELQQYISILDKNMLTPQQIQNASNLQGVLNASLSVGQDLSSVMGQIESVAKSGDVIGLSEFFAGRLSVNEIDSALASATSIQERMIALTELMNQRFEGNIERTRSTIEGQFEILSSIARQFKQNVIGFAGSGGFYDEIKAFINDFVGWFEARKEAIIDFAQELQGFLLQMFRFVRQQFQGMSGFTELLFQTIRKFIKNSRELVNPFVLFIAILTERMKSFFSGFIEGFKTFFVELKGIIQNTKEAWGEFFEFIGVDTEAELEKISGLVEGLFSPDNFENFGKVVGFLAGNMTTFIAVSWGIGKVISIFKSLGGLLARVTGLMNPYVAVTMAVIGAIILFRKAWNENWGGIQEKMEPVISWIQDKLLSTKEFLVNLWSSVWSEVLGFVREITPALKKIWTVLQPIVNILFVRFVESIKLVGKTLWSFVKGTWTLAINTIVNIWKIAWEVVSGYIETLLKFLTGDFSGAWESFTSMVSGIADIVGDQFMMIGKTVLGFFKETGGHILEFFDGFWEDTKKVFLGIFNWFIDKINSYILEPLNAVSSKVGFSIPTISRMGEGEQDTGRTQYLLSPARTQEDPFQLQPAVADQTAQPNVNQFNGGVNINVKDSGNPQQTAQEIRKELERYYRRKQDRGQ